MTMCLLAAEGRVKQAEAMLSMWAEKPSDDFELQLITALITLLEGVPETIRQADKDLDKYRSSLSCNSTELASRKESIKEPQNDSSVKLNDINDAVFDCLIELKKILKVSQLYIDSTSPDDNDKTELVLIDLFFDIARGICLKLEQVEALSS
ncbi:hypothetical protein R4P48_21505 [Atlantibacter subterranea]|uniref:Uncharacterized protein n=1 Tax=Atlantibacter subterraneus TaxID=255519 RepID=A0ABU4E7Y0_9ENTR|nr:hypothetical protein [Atlantibacter subterranea]MDV7025237.1 hypothetical protein [Atlantibacter subterranea]MDZ5668375.1 hypothetical protein [Atlantibacter hermannii]